MHCGMNLLALLSCLFLLAHVAADVVLDKKTMRLTLTSAKLSDLVYLPNPPRNGYDMLKSFNAEPDQAIIAKKDGYCYGVFRGTTLTVDDWRQNFRLGNDDLCGSDSTVTPEGAEEPPVCCSVRSGFYDAYHTIYFQDFEKALRHCAQDCLDPDECVVLTGHSQGGAIAAVAAITLADLNPYVITFGQPPTLAPGCPYITSARWYRWVNTRQDYNLGITYDPIPFSPGFGTECWGHFLVLGEDPSAGVAYLGLDSHKGLLPLDPIAAAHSMQIPTNGSDCMGYVDRIEALIDYHKNMTKATLADAAKRTSEMTKKDDSVATASKSEPTKDRAVAKNPMVPIPTDGFLDGALCSTHKECRSGSCQRETGLSWKSCFGVECVEDSDCESMRCDSGLCANKLGSCQPCDEDSDCIYDKCLGFQCTGPGKLMDENCGCFLNSNCRSGRCDGVSPRICEAILPMDARCNEDSDCGSGYCSWGLRCADPSLKQPEITIENKVLSWRTPVAVVAVVTMYYIAKYAIEWWFDTRAEYEEIAEAEANDEDKKP